MGSLLLLTEIAHVKIAVWRHIGRDPVCCEWLTHVEIRIVGATAFNVVTG